MGLLVGVWVARYLGPSRFGQLNYAIAFAALFSALATLGLDGIVVRELVTQPDRRDQILGASFTLKLIGGCIAFISVELAIHLLYPADPLTSRLVGIIAVGMIFQAFDVIDFWFQSRVQSKYTVYAKNAAFLVLAVIKVILILLGAGLQAFAWAASAEIALGALGLVVVFSKTESARRFAWGHWPDMRGLLVASWPLLLSGLAIMLYMRIDQVMLAGMSGVKEVGLYSAALRLSEVWYTIPTVIVTSVMPSLTKARSISVQDYYQNLQRLLVNLAGVAYLVAISITLTSTYLITFLYGHAYSAAGPILSVHIWAAVFVFLGVGASPWILNEGLMRYSLYQTTMGALANIGLNFILIPKYGALGCAIATAISQALSAWLSNMLFSETRPLFRLQVSALLLGRFRLSAGANPG